MSLFRRVNFAVFGWAFVPRPTVHFLPVTRWQHWALCTFCEPLNTPQLCKRHHLNRKSRKLRKKMKPGDNRYLKLHHGAACSALQCHFLQLFPQCSELFKPTSAGHGALKTLPRANGRGRSSEDSWGRRPAHLLHSTLSNCLATSHHSSKELVTFHFPSIHLEVCRLNLVLQKKLKGSRM